MFCSPLQRSTASLFLISFLEALSRGTLWAAGKLKDSAP